MTRTEMTAAEFKAGRKLLGLSQTEMAAMCGCTLRSVQNWEGGEYAVSDYAARLITAYLDGYRPEDWPDVQRKPHPLNMRGHKPDADGYDPYKWMHEQSEEVQAIEKARSLQHWKRMTAPLEDGEAD